MSQKPPTRKKLNAQQRFLENYKRCGFVTVAAEASGIDPRRHREWLADPEYRQRFEEAEDIAVEQALAEVRRRGVEGWEEPVIYQGALCYPLSGVKGGKPEGKPLTVRKYDSNLLMFLVKGKRPEYRDSWKGELSVKADATHHIDLKKLPDDKLDELIHILESANDVAATGYALGSSPNGKGHTREEPDS